MRDENNSNLPIKADKNGVIETESEDIKQAETVIETEIIHPYGMPEMPKPHKQIREQVTNMARTDKGIPVYVTNTLISATGELMDMDGVYYDSMGEPVQLMYGEDGMLITKEIYSPSRERLYPQIHLHPYFNGDIYAQNGAKYTSKIEEDDNYTLGKPTFMLLDSHNRPIYPLAGEHGGFLVDNAKKPIYPALAKGEQYHLPNGSGQVIHPTTVVVMNKHHMPVFPYGVEDINVFEKKEEPVWTGQPMPYGYYQGEQVQPSQPEQTPPPAPSQPTQQVQPSQPEPQANDWDYNPSSNNSGYYNDDYIEDDERIPADAESKWYKNKMVWIGAGSAILVLIIGVFFFNVFFGGNKDDFELFASEVTMEYKKDQKLELKDFFNSNMSSEGLKEIRVSADKLNYNANTGKITTKGSDKANPGEYAITFKYKKDTLTGKLIIEDTVAPEIIGSENVTFALGKYSDSALVDKYDITDESEVKVTVDTLQQNLTKEGTYKVDLTATDTSNNKTTKNVTVTVAKTAQQKEEEEKKKAEAERKRAEEQARKEEEERRRQEEEAKACVPSLPANSYTSNQEAWGHLVQIKMGVEKGPVELQEGQTYDIEEYESNCKTPYYMIVVK